MGRFTTEEEVDYTVDECVRNVNRLREMRLVFFLVDKCVRNVNRLCEKRLRRVSLC